MRKILNSKQMSDADRFTSEKRFVPSIVLMERAALAVCEEIEKHFCKKNIGVLCGVGNNGGDGMAVVRILSQRGYSVSYTVIGDEKKLSESAKIQMNILKAYGLMPVEKYKDLEICDVLIDAVFGTGLSRPVDDVIGRVFYTINKWNCVRVGIDIPSGINASTGEVMGDAVCCDMTVTFAFSKVGHFLYPGRQYSGNVIIKDIGITEESIENDDDIVLACEKSDVSYMLPKRLSDSHKGTYGKVLVIAGQKNMAGAAYLAAKASYLIGAGLVKILTEEDNRIILQQLLPEAMLCTYEKDCSNEVLLRELSWATTVVMGPGLGTKAGKQNITEIVIKNAKCPIVCDADALNILAKNIDLIKEKHPPIIITPHLGEMNRLCHEQVFDIMENLLETAKNFSDNYDVVTILKSASTVISVPKGKSYINLYGNNGMSTGGSGDILAGIIGGLLAQKMSLEDAAVVGTTVHSLAGDEAKKYVGAYAMKAEDILEGLVLILKQAETGNIQ